MADRPSVLDAVYTCMIKNKSVFDYQIKKTQFVCSLRIKSFLTYMPYRQLTNNDNDISCLRGVVFRNLHTYIIVLGQALSHKNYIIYFGQYCRNEN